MLDVVLISPDLDPTYFARNCSTNSFNSVDYTWNKTRAHLVARWKKITSTRQKHRVWRDRAKASYYRHRNQSPQPLPLKPNQDIIPTGVDTPVVYTFGSYRAEHIPLTESNFGFKFTAPIQPYVTDIVPCLNVFDVNRETLNPAQEGFATGTPSTRLPWDPVSVDPMEKNRRASAASRSSHCQRNEIENGLTPEQFLKKKKAEGVALVMAAFNKWLDKKLAVASYAYETAGASGNSTASGGIGSQGSGGNGQSERSSRRPKRQLDGGDLNNSLSGGDENGRDKGGNKRAKKDPEAGRKFACPFYKHDPRTHRKERTCCGPGWDSIHRLKEHLYRKHRLPKHACPRCGESFGGANGLTAHLRADITCKTVDIGPVDGIDEEMESKLKVRKTQSGLTEEERWLEIYLILFPKANREKIPSPYYDGTDGLGQATSAAEWKTMERRIRKELPKYVQKKVEHKFELVNMEMLEGLPGIIRDGLHELLGSSESPAESPAGSPKPASVAVDCLPPIVLEEPPHADATAAADEGESALTFDPLDYLTSGFGFQPDQFDFDSIFNCNETGSDSGYASGSTGRGVAFV